MRLTLGRFPDLDATEARERARRALADMGEGKNPTAERRRQQALDITLREGLEIHLATRDLAESTVTGYRTMARLHLSDWLDRPLRELGEDRAAVRERHLRVTLLHGRTSADYALRVLRLAYNRALRQCPDLPLNPCVNVDFNGTRRRKVDLDPDRLRAWGRAVDR